MEILPGVTTPVPPENVADRLELEPAVMVAGLAVKLLMEGGVELTVTVVAKVAVRPEGEVTVSVYEVVDVGLTVTAVPLVAAMLPGVMTPVPPVKVPVRLELCPELIAAGLAAKLTIVGAVPPVPLGPLPPQPVSDTIPSPKMAAITAAKRPLRLMASSNEVSRFQRSRIL